MGKSLSVQTVDRRDPIGRELITRPGDGRSRRLVVSVDGSEHASRTNALEPDGWYSAAIRGVPLGTITDWLVVYPAFTEDPKVQ